MSDLKRPVGMSDDAWNDLLDERKRIAQRRMEDARD